HRQRHRENEVVEGPNSVQTSASTLKLGGPTEQHAVPGGLTIGDGEVEMGGKPSGLHKNGFSTVCTVIVRNEKLGAGRLYKFVGGEAEVGDSVSDSVRQGLLRRVANQGLLKASRREIIMQIVSNLATGPNTS
ncbi:hypothetical protein CR513_46253, partial [Mucuna pruriens]